MVQNLFMHRGQLQTNRAGHIIHGGQVVVLDDEPDRRFPVEKKHSNDYKIEDVEGGGFSIKTVPKSNRVGGIPANPYIHRSQAPDFRMTPVKSLYRGGALEDDNSNESLKRPLRLSEKKQPSRNNIKLVL